MKVALAILIIIALQSGETKKKAEVPATGELNGFVFLITKGGDIKPARLASVTLLYISEKKLPSSDDYPDTAAGGRFIKNHIAEIRKQVDNINEQIRTHNFKSDEANCSANLREYTEAIKSTSIWAHESNKLSQIMVEQLDEEGNFKIAGVPTGFYIVIVSGRAGVNEAVWQKLDVEITAGQATSIKMPTPENVCVQP